MKFKIDPEVFDVCPFCGEKMMTGLSTFMVDWVDGDGIPETENDCLNAACGLAIDFVQGKIVWFYQRVGYSTEGKCFDPPINKEEFLRWLKLRSFE